jgi:hypothetical protein
MLKHNTAVNYHINTSAVASIGYANITNYAFDKETKPGVQINEDRIWQQILLRHSIGRVFLDHRYRFEQRWLHSVSGTRYANRFRYLVRTNIPLNSEQLQERTMFLSFYNELFINTANGGFDRNRLYGAIGYQLTPELQFQLGGLAQTVNAETKLYLQIGSTYNIDLRDSK